MTDRGDEVDRVEQQTTPPTPVIYETVRRNGEQEMMRPAVSLWWSGLAAGLSLSFSVLAQAILRGHLPDATWRELLVALGYPVGFLMAVLSRQQLFTENTITVMLPIMAEPTRRNLGRGARMWSIVLASNLVGTLFAAAFCTFVPVISPDTREQMLAVSAHSMQFGWIEMGLRGISAGFLMAAMVWLMPAAGPAQFHVVVVITYLIGVGGFPHIVAGSVEAFLLLLNGQASPADLAAFFFPTFAGNVVGGTALFALLAHAQVMREIGGSS